MDLFIGDWIIMGGLVAVLIAMVPTTIQVMREGNAADPLRREIEEELREREREERRRAA